MMFGLMCFFIGTASAQELVGKDSSTMLNVDVGKLSSPFINQNMLQMSFAKKSNGRAFGLNASYAVNAGDDSVKGLSKTMVNIANSRSANSNITMSVYLSGFSLIGFGQFDWFKGVNVRQRTVQCWAGGGFGVVEEKRYTVGTEQIKFQERSLTPVIMPSVGGRLLLSDHLSWDLSVGIRYNISEGYTGSISKLTNISTGVGLHF